MQALSFNSPYKQGETPYQIFQNRMNAVGTIVDGVKNIIANKYINNQLNQIADGILNQVDENKANDLINLINEPPPDNIYPSGLEDTIGQFVDKSMSKMMQKEQMMGNLPDLPDLNQPNQAGLPQVGTQPASSETMIPKGDMFQLYNAVKSMPSGQMNWANLFKTMTAKKPYFMGTTGAEEFVMNQMQTQIKDPKDEMSKNIDLAAKYKEAFYPETTTDKPSSDYERWKADPEGYAAFKAVGKEPEKELDVNALNTFMTDNGLKVKGVTVNEKGERNISLEPIGGGDPDLSEMLTLIKGLEANGFNASYSKNGLSVSIPNPTTTGTLKTTTAEANFAEKAFEGIKTNAQYDKALAKVRQIDPSVIVPSKIELFEDNYNAAINYLRSAIDENGQIREGEDPRSKSKLTFEQAYSEWYNYLEQAVNEYRIATGETLENPFVSLEEYKKMDKKTNIFHLPSTLGTQGSVFKSGNNYKDGDIEVINGKKYKYNAGEDKWEVVSS